MATIDEPTGAVPLKWSEADDANHDFREGVQPTRQARASGGALRPGCHYGARSSCSCLNVIRAVSRANSRWADNSGLSRDARGGRCRFAARVLKGCGTPGPILMFLIDTNVVSELRKIGTGRVDPNVALWARGTSAAAMYLSCVSLQELETGILLVERRDHAQGNILRQWYEHKVLPSFADHLLPIDAAVARCCAKLHVPDPRPARDAFIGATALVHGLTLVTRNTSDFAPMQVPMLNPWDAAP